jgi:UPF0271 protein
MKIYILDASAIINGFYSKDSLNLMPPSAVSEIKDINSKMRLENCIDNGFLKIEDVNIDQYLQNILISSGDLMRLSNTDKEIIALALKYKNEGNDVITVTDDYSMQNTLKILNIKFRTVRTKGIKKTIKWQRLCKGCRKEYPADSTEEICEICGSPIIRKRVNARSNH